MKLIHSIALATAAALPTTVAIVAPAHAQVGAVAVADANTAVARSRAFTAASQQIQAQYKTQIDQANTRRQAIEAELRPLVQAFETARAAPGANEASLRTQAQTIQTRETAAQQELGRLTEPAQRAQAYAIEQITAKLSDAVRAATQRKNVGLLLRPDAALFVGQPAADITADITTELDRLVPSVSVAVPAGWQPGQQGRAAAGAPAAAAPAPASARPSQGR